MKVRSERWSRLDPKAKGRILQVLVEHRNKIVLVQRALGHRDLCSVMVYLHIQPDQPRIYDVKVSKFTEEEEISATIAEGWRRPYKQPTGSGSEGGVCGTRKSKG